MTVFLPDARAQRVIDELNRLRSAPAVYAGHLEIHARRLQGLRLQLDPGHYVMTEEGHVAVDEAVQWLRTVAVPVPMLRHEPAMSRAAGDHIADQGRYDRAGHAGTDWSTSWQRLERYGRWLGLAAENISYGPADPREAIVNLLIDDGVPDRGHRFSLLDGRYGCVGAAFGPHVFFGSMCVIELAQGYQPY